MQTLKNTGRKKGERYKMIRFYRAVDGNYFFLNFYYLYTGILHCERGSIERPEDTCEIRGCEK
jgi:hypothetical protein